MSTYFVGLYWDARKENRLSCASRVANFLSVLSEVDKNLSTWYKKSTRKINSQNSISVDIGEIEKILNSNNRDTDGGPISELGFSTSFWTKTEEMEQATLAVTCGAYSPYVKNAVVLTFGKNQQPSDEKLKKILELGVDVFSPTYGTVVTQEELAKNQASLVWEVPSLFSYKKE